MWITLIIIVLSLLLFLYVFRQNAIEKMTTYPQIHTLTLLVFYIPIFIVNGLGPAILAMRKYYGPTFCLHIWGMKRRIFFITESNGRSAISRNAHIRLPAAQVAQVFGISKEATEMFGNHEYIHEIGSTLQGIGLKDLTSRHSTNLQKTIDECLNQDQKWTEGGLYDLCSTLVYESITTTLFGANVDARSIVKQLKILDTDVHLLAYPSPFRWLKPDLVGSRNKIAKHFSSTNPDGSENFFATKINEFATTLSNDDVGNMKTAILWASFGNIIPAIFWTYFYLRHYPNILNLILDEMKSAPPEIDEVNLVSHMPQMDSVIEETMRLVANPLVVRECVQGTKVSITGVDHEISLAENDIIVLFPFASQIDEEYFPRPYEFIHDRFLAGSQNEVSATARRVHAPFGEGKFICPGRHLGKNITKLTIVALLKQFDIEFSDHCENMKTPGMLKSRHGFGIPPPEKDLRIRYRVK